MADRINPNRKNHLSLKDITKRSAVLTLFLSTVACSGNDYLLLLFCIPFAPVIIFPIIQTVAELVDEKRNKKKGESRKYTTWIDHNNQGH